MAKARASRMPAGWRRLGENSWKNGGSAIVDFGQLYAFPRPGTLFHNTWPSVRLL
jgi:hypothetical protein